MLTEERVYMLPWSSPYALQMAIERSKNSLGLYVLEECISRLTRETADDVKRTIHEDWRRENCARQAAFARE